MDGDRTPFFIIISHYAPAIRSVAIPNYMTLTKTYKPHKNLQTSQNPTWMEIGPPFFIIISHYAPAMCSMAIPNYRTIHGDSAYQCCLIQPNLNLPYWLRLLSQNFPSQMRDHTTPVALITHPTRHVGTVLVNELLGYIQAEILFGGKNIRREKVWRENVTRDFY